MYLKLNDVDDISKPIHVPNNNQYLELQTFQKFNEFRHQGILCDVIFECDDGTEIYAHKLVLSAVSLYFQSMFQINMIEKDKNRIKIREVNGNCLESLVNFAYTSNIIISVEDLFYLLVAANMFCFNDVEKSCIEFLSKSLSIDNCVDICTIAERINCEELHKVAMLYVSDNFRQLVRCKHFIDLTASQIETILDSEHISVSSESEVYEAVMKWVQHDIQNRLENLSLLLKKVRFCLMSRKYLVDRVLHEPIVMQDDRSRDIVLKALDHHLLPERGIEDTYDIINVPRQITNRTLYVVGGSVNGKARSSAECFDFKSQQWLPVPTMLVPRKHVSAAVLEGFLYAVGGIMDGKDLCSVEMYDPTIEEWGPVDSLSKCKGALATAVMDGWLYAIGGSDKTDALKYVERYDPLKNKWSVLPSMRLPRSYFDVAELNGKIYAIGGYCGISEVEHCEYFEPVSRKWLEINGMNKSRMHHRVISYKGRIYTFGGKNSMGLLNSIEKFNPELNMWLTIKTNIDFRIGMNLHLGFKPLVECEEIMVLGGLNNEKEDQKNTSIITLRSPDFNIYSSLAMLEERSFAGVAIM